MIRFALIVASTLGFVLTAALGNFMAPLLQELERFRPQEQQEPQTPVQSRVPALGGLRRLPRLALEAAAAAAVLVLLAVNGCLPTGLQLPGAGYVELGGAAPVLWGLVLVALAECARTADGADGTVCGTAFAAMLGLMMLETRLGWRCCRQHWPGHCWPFCCGIFRPQSCGRAAAAACIWLGCWAACRCASGMQS